MDISSSSSAITKGKKSSHVFSWAIDNFEKEHVPTSETAQKIECPKFEVLHPDGVSITSWSVYLSVDKTDIAFAGLSLESCPSKYLQNNGGLRCSYGVYAATTSNPKSHGSKASRTFNTGSEKHWGSSKWIPIQDLRDKGLLQDGCLRIRAQVKIFAQPESTVTSNIVNIASISGTEAAALEPVVNFGSLLKNEQFSDLKIECGSETFSAPKAILAGRSEMFKAMLTSDMEEARSGIIKITDLSSSVFGIILHHFYTGRVADELDHDILHEMIYGAEKYGLNELKNYCFRKLLGCICEENVAALAVAAYLYGAEEKVKSAIRTFIEPQFFLLVKKNSEFKKMVEKYPTAFL